MDAFEVLADPTRRSILQHLSEGEHRAGELARATGASKAAVSKHLRVLLEAGVVEDERVVEDARVRLFRLRPEALVAVQAFLDQLQADWTVQLGRFKDHVERSNER
jgi:DNA-binding transcriptional ArsR family regulator